MIMNLWATPVARYSLKSDFCDFEGANEAMIRAWPQRTHESNLMDFQMKPEFIEFNCILKTKIAEYARDVELGDDLVHFKGHFNEHYRGHSNTPHAHPLAKVVAVYYARSEPGNGDILLQDPRGGVQWADVVEDDARGSSGARSFFRIRPEAGDLVVFPGYVIHSVTTNELAEPSRLSVGINFFSRSFLSHFDSSL